MKGVVFNIVEDVVSEHVSPLAWDDLLQAAGVEHGHSALGTYDDDEMMRIVDCAGEMFSLDRRAMLVWIGKRATAHFVRRYPRYFAGYTSAYTFLPTLDRIIHPDVRKLDPKAVPPSFDCTRRDDRHMTVIYRSRRPMCGLAEGLIHGLGDHFDQRIAIRHPECESRGDARCRFELAF